VNNLGRGKLKGGLEKYVGFGECKMNEDSRGGSGRRDRLAILEIIREKSAINQVDILVVFGAGIGRVSVTNNVGNDGVE
jgi:hypothetical protein